MSIIGCYSLDLYCRFDGMSHGPQAGTVKHPFAYFPHQFTGRTFSECKAQAKKSGWIFGADDDATCPMCAKKRHEQSEKGEN